MAQKRAMVIGASGMVGSALVNDLTNRGIEVVGTCFEQDHPSCIRVDVRDTDAMRALISVQRPDLVFYLAGYTYADGCEADPLRSYDTSVVPMFALVDSMREISAKLVFFSSEYVFDGEDGPYSETAEVQPLSVYGKHKVQSETIVAESGLDFLIIRTTWVYGLDHKEKCYPYYLRRMYREGKKVEVASDQVSTPTYVGDLASSTVQLALRKLSGVWNIAGPDRISRVAWAYAICGAMGIDHRFIIPMTTSRMGSVAPRPLNAGLIIDKLHSQRIVTLGVDRGLESFLQDWHHQVDEGTRFES